MLNTGKKNEIVGMMVRTDLHIKLRYGAARLDRAPNFD
jgi:hypothetical protein